MKGLADIAYDEVFRAEARARATKDATTARRASLRRLKKRIGNMTPRLYPVERREIYQCIDAWAEREAKRGAR